MKASLRTALVGACFAALLLAAPSAHAAFPGANGKIAFVSGGAIWTMGPGGSGRTQFKPAATQPAWSPEGGRLAYTASNGVHIVSEDGSGDSLLVAGGSQPAWAPSGDKLVVLVGSPDCPDLRTVRLDGSVESTSPGCDQDTGLFCCYAGPAWQPNGNSYIIHYQELEVDPTTCEFGDPCPGEPGPPQINGFRGANANWSPYGDEYVVHTTDWGSFGAGDIVVRGAGGSFRELTTAGGDTMPAWSPDGTKVAFERAGSIYVMSAASGSGVTSLGSGGDPDWQPITNRPPDCSGVTASPSVLTTHNRRFVPVTLDGATDPDGDPVSLSIDGVSQDEPVTGPGDHTSPDAIAESGAEVRLRAERDPRADGRVYRITFTASDGRGGSCSGDAKVGVPRKKRKAAIDSAPPSYDSFAR